MSERRPATTIDDAAFVHTSVFTEPVWGWPDELAAQVPSFDELYVAERPSEGLGDPIRIMRDRLVRTPGPVKLLMTGQKGSGKSWALKKLGQGLTEKFTVVTVSATDRSGVTVPEADVQDLLMLIAAELARHTNPVELAMRSGVQVDAAVGQRLARWVELLTAAGVREAPTRTDAWTAELQAWIFKIATRLRSDDTVRKELRSVPAEDMAEVVRALIDVLRGRGREVVVLFDDIDKIDLVSARRIFLTQSTVLTTLNCRMVLTYPFSLNFEGVFLKTVGVQTPIVLRNVKVVTSRTDPTMPASARAYFEAVLARVMEPRLVDEEALLAAIRLSAGVPREFGLILQRACLHAYYGGGTKLDLAALRLAERELRIEMQRATQSSEIRDALCDIRGARQLAGDADRALLDRNLVVEHVNGEPWYDVHPILAPTVDEWLAAEKKA